jgi:hypothetical protein
VAKAGSCANAGAEKKVKSAIVNPAIIVIPENFIRLLSIKYDSPVDTILI